MSEPRCPNGCGPLTSEPDLGLAALGCNECHHVAGAERTPAVRERPILFSAPMVRALLAGTKTQTRRIITPQPEHLQHHEWRGETLYDGEHRLWWWKRHSFESLIDCAGDCDALAKLSPYGVAGDRLWVRETFYCDDYTAGDFKAARVGYVSGTPTDEQFVEQWRAALDYRADHECRSYEAGCPCADDDGRSMWRPSIHMPRWASRITLAITGVRVERLHDIDELGALAEGVEGESVEGVLNGVRGEYIVGSARDDFARLWAAINGADSWKANPWVWVVEFKRLPEQR